jgi:UTP--glucose-1-phosphate uridylyltransferase
VYVGFFEAYYYMSMKVRKAAFPAAGLGTRFLPATKAQPKEMLPLVDKPLIQYGVEEAIASGIDNIIIITGRGKNAIEDHFDVSYELEKILEQRGEKDLLRVVQSISDMINMSYVRQKEALGIGHALLTARELIGHEPFACFLGDDIIDSEIPCMKQLLEIFYEKENPVVAIEEVAPADVSAYGIIAGEQVGENLYRITEMIEKPPREEAPSNLAIIGRYVLTPDLFDILNQVQRDRKGEIQLTNGLKLLLKERPIFGYKFKGTRYDAGNKLGFLKATVEFALKRSDLGEAFRNYLLSLKLQ